MPDEGKSIGPVLAWTAIVAIVAFKYGKNWGAAGQSREDRSWVQRAEHELDQCRFERKGK